MHDGHLRLLTKVDIQELKSKIINFPRIDQCLILAFDNFLALSELEFGSMRVEILCVDGGSCCKSHSHDEGQSIQFAYTLESKMRTNKAVCMMLDSGFKGVIVGKTGTRRWFCGSVGGCYDLRYSDDDVWSHVVKRI